MTVLAVVQDLIDRTKIETVAKAIGTPVRFISECEAVHCALEAGDGSRLFLDLDKASQSPLALIRDLRAAVPAIPIIGYCAHVHTALQEHALAAGCTRVLPRSLFVKHLPELLVGTLRPDG